MDSLSKNTTNKTKIYWRSGKPLSKMKLCNLSKKQKRKKKKTKSWSSIRHMILKVHI